MWRNKPSGADGCFARTTPQSAALTIACGQSGRGSDSPPDCQSRDCASLTPIRGAEGCGGSREVRGWKGMVGGVMTPPYGVRWIVVGAVGELGWRAADCRPYGVRKITRGCGGGAADGRWGATRPPPVAGGGRGAIGSGRRETKVRQHRGYSPGTATGPSLRVRRGN